MEVFETRLANATKIDHAGDRNFLAAMGVVLDSTGKTLYRYASGYQNFSPDAPYIDKETTFFTAAAGNFITHIATLQLVEKGIIGLDEPVSRMLPELSALPVISAPADGVNGYNLNAQTTTMTVRHLLTHSSGIPGDDTPLIEAWRRNTPPRLWPVDSHATVVRCSIPLLFQPGEGWQFGHSVHWLQVLISRSSGEEFVDYINGHIFRPLGMEFSMYPPQEARIRDRCLQTAGRRSWFKAGIIPQVWPFESLMCSISDFERILLELISSSPTILNSDSIATLLEPAFLPESNALKMLRTNTKDYAAPAGISLDKLPPPVNFNCAGSLVVMDDLPKSGFPAGTVTWNGSKNVVWAVHPEKGIAMLFVTQVVPEDDPRAISFMMEFFRGARSSYLRN